jgi:hypothetical protein
MVGFVSRPRSQNVTHLEKRPFLSLSHRRAIEPSAAPLSFALTPLISIL